VEAGLDVLVFSRSPVFRFSSFTFLSTRLTYPFAHGGGRSFLRKEAQHRDSGGIYR